MTDASGWERSGPVSVQHEEHSSVQDCGAGCGDVSLLLERERELLQERFARFEDAVTELRVALRQTDEIGLDANGTDY